MTATKDDGDEGDIELGSVPTLGEIELHDLVADFDEYLGLWSDSTRMPDGGLRCGVESSRGPFNVRTYRATEAGRFDSQGDFWAATWARVGERPTVHAVGKGHADEDDALKEARELIELHVRKKTDEDS